MCFFILYCRRFKTIYSLYLKKDVKGYKKNHFQKKQQQDSSLPKINNALYNSTFSLFHISINTGRIRDTFKFHTNAPHGVEPLLLITPYNSGIKSIRDNILSTLHTHSLIYAPPISLMTLELKETYS